MSSIIVGRVWGDERLGGTTQHVMLCLGEHCRIGTLACYPSKAYVASRCGYALSTVHAAVAEAIRVGSLHEIDWRDVPEGVERQLGKRGRSNLCLVLCGLRPEQIADAIASFGLDDYATDHPKIGRSTRPDRPSDHPTDRPIDRPKIGHKHMEPEKPGEEEKAHDLSSSSESCDHPNIGRSSFRSIAGLRASLRRLGGGLVVYRHGHRCRLAVASDGNGLVLSPFGPGREQRLYTDADLEGLEVPCAS